MIENLPVILSVLAIVLSIVAIAVCIKTAIDAKGEVGPQGPMGPAGPKGDKGDRGPMGSVDVIPLRGEIEHFAKLYSKQAVEEHIKDRHTRRKKKKEEADEK